MPIILEDHFKFHLAGCPLSCGKSKIIILFARRSIEGNARWVPILPRYAFTSCMEATFCSWMQMQIQEQLGLLLEVKLSSTIFFHVDQQPRHNNWALYITPQPRYLGQQLTKRKSNPNYGTTTGIRTLQAWHLESIWNAVNTNVDPAHQKECKRDPIFFVFIIFHILFTPYTSATLNIVVSVTYYLELRNVISICCKSHVLPTNAKLVVWISCCRTLISLLGQEIHW